MRIAIVDDDIQMCEQLRTLLNEFLGDSSEISDYRSGEEFLTAWETADFDLIILDIFINKITIFTICYFRHNHLEEKEKESI